MNAIHCLKKVKTYYLVSSYKNNNNNISNKLYSAHKIKHICNKKTRIKKIATLVRLETRMSLHMLEHMFLITEHQNRYCDLQLPRIHHETLYQAPIRTRKD